MPELLPSIQTLAPLNIWDRAWVQESGVTVLFPEAGSEDTACSGLPGLNYAAFRFNLSDHSVFSDAKLVQSSHWVYCSAYAVGSNTDPTNSVTLIEITKFIASNVIYWRALSFEMTWFGIVQPFNVLLSDGQTRIFFLNPYCDEVVWTYREDDCTTRIFSYPFDYRGEIEHYYHQDPSVDSSVKTANTWQMIPARAQAAINGGSASKDGTRGKGKAVLLTFASNGNWKDGNTVDVYNPYCPSISTGTFLWLAKYQCQYNVVATECPCPTAGQTTPGTTGGGTTTTPTKPVAPTPPSATAPGTTVTSTTSPVSSQSGSALAGDGSSTASIMPLPLAQSYGEMSNVQPGMASAIDAQVATFGWAYTERVNSTAPSSSGLSYSNIQTGSFGTVASVPVSVPPSMMSLGITAKQPPGAFIGPVDSQLTFGLTLNRGADVAHVGTTGSAQALFGGSSTLGMTVKPGTAFIQPSSQTQPASLSLSLGSGTNVFHLQSGSPLPTGIRGGISLSLPAILPAILQGSTPSTLSATSMSQGPDIFHLFSASLPPVSAGTLGITLPYSSPVGVSATINTNLTLGISEVVGTNLFHPGTPSSGPVVQSFTTASNPSTTSHTLNITYPSSIAANDLLVLLAANNTGGFGFATPSGFFGPIITGSDSSGHETAAVYYRLANGTEAGSLTVSLAPPGSVSGNMTLTMLRITGASTISPVDVSASNLIGNASSSTQPTPTVTTTGTNRLVVSFGVAYTTSALSVSSVTAGQSMTQDGVLTNAAGQFWTGVYSGLFPSSGATGTINWSFSAAFNNGSTTGWAGFTIAFK